MRTISPEAMMPQRDGRWTRDNVGEAWASAHRALRSELGDPEVSQVLVMVGTPGSGKSTWLAEQPDLDHVVAFDAVWADPARRVAIARRISDAGKEPIAVCVTSPLSLCIARNAERPAWRRVPEASLRAAWSQLQLNPVSADEGWADVWSVVGTDVRLDRQTDQDRDAAAGRTFYRWRTEEDDRVRPEHRARHGRIFSWVYPPEGGHPGADFNCFPEDVLVEVPGDSGLLYRRHYDGPGVELHFEHGVLRSTPNHPILTTRGWVPANQIDEGDYVIRASFQDSGVSDRDRRVSTFGELAKLGHHLRRHTLVGGEFHGDASVDDEVDVVGVDGHLGADIDAPGDEQILQMALSLADSLGLTLGALDQGGLRHRGSTPSIVSRSGEFGPLLGRHPSHALDHRVAAASDRIAGLDEPPHEGRSGHAHLDRERLQRFARCVSLSKVVEVRRRGLSIVGMVHNLSVSTGWYICNGIIVHNCRCWPEMIKDENVVETIDGVLRARPLTVPKWARSRSR